MSGHMQDITVNENWQDLNVVLTNSDMQSKLLYCVMIGQSLWREGVGKYYFIAEFCL